MLKAIAHAQCSVTIEAYIYWAGEIGRRFAARARRARQRRYLREDPARCRRFVDDRRRDSRDARKRRVPARVVQPRASVQHRPVQSPDAPQIAHHRRPHRVHRGRGHRGSLDGHTPQDDQHWRDIQIRMEGPAVVPLQTGFAHNWLQATGELVTGFEFYPALDTPAGTLAVQTILSSPETGASTARTFYYLSIAAARRSIYIANPYFVPDQGAIDLLVAAKGRGVDVRVMVAGIHNDNWLARQNSVRLYGPLPESRHRHLRVQPHDASPENDGRRRRVVDRGHHELRQPLVRAQRGEQRLLLRRGARRGSSKTSSSTT